MLRSYTLLLVVQTILLRVSMAVRWNWQRPAERRNRHAETELTTRPLTSAAELFYLHHIRSCAAATTHAQKRHSGQGVVLVLSGREMLLLELASLVESAIALGRRVAGLAIHMGFFGRATERAYSP